jgi:di/tricarboxylate transporter
LPETISVRGTDKKSDQNLTRRVRTVVVVFICVPAIAALTAWGVASGQNPASDMEYTQAQLLDEALGMSHDELIMLMVSVVVVIQIVTNFNFLKRLPRWPVLLCSFGMVAMSAFFTVAEGFFFPELLNVAEHLLFMGATVLLAVWCWFVFGSAKQEDS